MRRRLATMVAVVAVLATGCGGVPAKGVPRVVRKVPADVPELPELRVERRPPRAQPDFKPDEIVRNFFLAQVDSAGGYAIARTYLAPRVAWNAAAGVTVDADREVGEVVVKGDRATVRLVHRPVGTITAGGEFRPAAAVGESAVELTLQRFPSLGWRLTAVPSGIRLSQVDLVGSFQRTLLYFADESRQRLVPDALFLPVSDHPVAAAVRRLVDGPRLWLAPAVGATFPASTEALDVEVVDDTVTVDFSREIRLAPAESLRALIAQVVWTVTEPGPTGSAPTKVRLLVEGEPLAVAGRAGNREHTRGEWASFAPARTPREDRLYLLRHGVPYALDAANRPVRVAPVGSLVAVAVNRQGTALAGITAPAGGRQSLVVVDLTGARGVRTLATANRLLAPAWEPTGDVVWVVETVGTVQQVVAITTGATPAATTVTAPFPGTVQSLLLSPSGARAVAVVGAPGRGTLYVGRVERHASGARVVAEPRPVAPSISGVAVAAFDGPAHLIFARSQGGQRSLWRVDPDGYNLARQSETGLPAVAVSGVTVSSGEPGIRVVAAAGRLWRRTGTVWTELTAGTAPAYPG